MNHASWLRAVQSEFEATSRIDPPARALGSGGCILEQAIRALTPVWLHRNDLRQVGIPTRCAVNVTPLTAVAAV
jgi:hypothetical protein